MKNLINIIDFIFNAFIMSFIFTVSSTYFVYVKNFKIAMIISIIISIIISGIILYKLLKREENSNNKVFMTAFYFKIFIVVFILFGIYNATILEPKRIDKKEKEMRLEIEKLNK